MTGKSLAKEKISEILCDVYRLNEINPANKFTGVRLDGNTEPLLYKDIPWLLRENEIMSPQPERLAVSVVTNGVLLDSGTARCLLENSVRNIHISATGLTAGVYREFQGSNLPVGACERNLDTVKDNVISLIAMKKEMNAATLIELRYVMSAASAGEFISYLEYWRGQGADRVFVGGMGDGTLKAESRALGKIASRQSCKRFGQIIVQAAGDVILSCCDYEMQPVGNVYEQSFFDIMTSPAVLQYEQAHKELDTGRLPRICANCPDMHVYEDTGFGAGRESLPDAVGKYRKEFLEAASAKKLIVWGAGAEFELVWRRYLRDCAPAYVVDSDPERWSSVVHGLRIKPPDALKSEESANTVVLIAASHFFDIQRRLSSLGMRHHYFSLLFLDRYFVVDGHAAATNTIPLQ